jgi:thiol-disulfide isomerase/thioredoxin
MKRTRRRLIGSLATVGSLSGCLSVLGGDTDDSPGRTVETYAVGGSPGETIPVRPDGEVVLLDFFATWCAPCKPQMESLGTVRDRFPDVHMLSITWESDSDAIRAFWADYDGNWPVASDPEIETGEQYGVDRIPTLIVFDTGGTERWRHTGLASVDAVATELRAAGAEG